MSIADLLQRPEQPLWCSHVYDGKCSVPENYEDLKRDATKNADWSKLDFITIQYEVKCKQNQSFCQINKRLGGNQ